MEQNVQNILCYSNIGNVRHELLAIGNNSLHQKQTNTNDLVNTIRYAKQKIWITTYTVIMLMWNMSMLDDRKIASLI